MFYFLEISNKLDMIYLIDVSKDTDKETLDEVRDLITKDLLSYKLSRKDSRIGIVTFADAPTTILDISEGVSEQNVKKSLYDIKNKESNADIAKAFNYMRYSFDWTDTGRKSVPKLVVLLTTKKGKISPEAVQSGNNLKEQAKIIVVGIGEKANINDLEKLATDKDHASIAGQPEDLSKQIRKIKQAIGESTSENYLILFSVIIICYLTEAIAGDEA